MQRRAFFICGTDTDVGKTIVTAALLRCVPQAIAIKVVQTGETLLDQHTYQRACPSAATTTLAHFKLPASAHLAAAKENRTLDIAALARTVQHTVAPFPFALLEGSGGILSPLTETETFLDLVCQCPYPVILVARNTLGAINQTLLSLEVLRQRGIAVAGVIMNRVSHNNPSFNAQPATDASVETENSEKSTAARTIHNGICEDNKIAIRRLANLTNMVELPYIPGFSQSVIDAAAWQCAEKILLPFIEKLMPLAASSGTSSVFYPTSEPFSAHTLENSSKANSYPAYSTSDTPPHVDKATASSEISAPATQTPRCLVEFDRHHLWHPYAPVMQPSKVWSVARTEGNYLVLHDGRRLLDGMASWWCAIHGYGNIELVETLQTQAARMSHVMFGGLTHEPAVALGEALCKVVPQGLDRVFFADSGSVAMEVAMKMALQYWHGRGLANKSRFISLAGGYHGDTLGAMSVCDPINGMHAHFAKVLPKHIFVPRPSSPFGQDFDPASIEPLRAALATHHQECAALVLEPIVQGAGGMWFYHPQYLQEAHALCRQYDVLLIADEIATGFGRTGRFFASEWAGVTPDILCVGKALTGGMLTLAATLATTQVAEGLSAGGGVLMHGPTFMANPLACAVACKSIELLQNSPWQARVATMEAALRAGLSPCQGHPAVADVRTLGAIGVVEMKEPVRQNELQAFFVDNYGVWIRPFGRLIYVMPPYTLTAAELNRLTSAICDAVMKLCV